MNESLKFTDRKEEIMNTQNSFNFEQITSNAPSVNWSQVGWFLSLAFGLTWLLNLALYLAVD